MVIALVGGTAVGGLLCGYIIATVWPFVHIHRWGKWTRATLNYVNKGYEVDGQKRHCATCGLEQTRAV